jgi:hypothetical protein
MSTGGQILERVIRREADREYLVRRIREGKRTRTEQLDRWATRACWWLIGIATGVIVQALLRAALNYDRWKWMVTR